VSVREEKKKAELQGRQTQHPNYFYRLVWLLFSERGEFKGKQGMVSRLLQKAGNRLI